MDSKRQLLCEIVEEVFDNSVYRMEEINKILPSDYVEAAIDGLLELIDRIEKYHYNDNPEIFARNLEKFFMIDDVYQFGYDGNTLKGYNEDPKDIFDEIKSKAGQPLSRKDKKILNKVLAHTFFPLINGVDNNPDNRRAICSGYSQLGCIIAAYFGFEYYPIVAQVKEENSDLISYEYAHYLFAISRGDKGALVDLQSANSLYRIKTMNDNPNTIDKETRREEAFTELRNFHKRSTLMYATPVEYDEYNKKKFIHGGLGENSSEAVEISKQVPNSVIKPPDFRPLINTYGVQNDFKVAI